jgi:hypothetical protein
LVYMCCLWFLIVGGFYSEVALQKREAEGTVYGREPRAARHSLDVVELLAGQPACLLCCDLAL